MRKVIVATFNSHYMLPCFTSRCLPTVSCKTVVNKFYWISCRIRSKIPTLVFGNINLSQGYCTSLFPIRIAEIIYPISFANLSHFSVVNILACYSLTIPVSLRLILISIDASKFNDGSTSLFLLLLNDFRLSQINTCVVCLL